MDLWTYNVLQQKNAMLRSALASIVFALLLIIMNFLLMNIFESS